MVNVLKAYGLPPQFDFDKEKALEILQKDKKKAGKGISYILLKKIGKGYIQQLDLNTVSEII